MLTTQWKEHSFDLISVCYSTHSNNFSIYMYVIYNNVRRQFSFLGHVLRKDELEKLVVTGFVDGKRARGRQETFLTYLGNMKQKTPRELLQMAKNITVWSMLCT